MAECIPRPMDLELTSHFECPVCFDYVLPPIQQCHQGHLLCGTCRLNLSSNACPTCRISLDGTGIRNLALEKIASHLYFPCKYASNGCKCMLKWIHKLDHQEQCRFRSPKCPIPYCHSFEGSFIELVAHLKVNHRVLENVGENFECIIGSNGFQFSSKDYESELNFQLLSCHGQHFLVIFKKVDIGVMFFEYQYQGLVQMIGAENKATGFNYRLEIGKGRQKFSWEGAVLSINESVAEAFNSGNCFHMHPNTVRLLAKPGAIVTQLGISVSISKSQDS